MNRRRFLQGPLALPLLGMAGPALAQPQQNLWPEIERRVGGRLGVAVLDTAGSGALQGHRLDERFPMCSTFKWLAAACVLSRVDAGQERLDRRIRYGREAVLRYAPVTAAHAGRDGMTVGALCDAAVTLSDNTAGNLLLRSFGGPAGLTRYLRTLGDSVTRLDRWEPELNESTPGDPRDTTSPRAMAETLHKAVLGDALKPASREQLVQWLQACRTNGKRLGAPLPPGWRVGSKTGTGERGSTNDVGVYWPPGRPPIVVAVYLTDTRAPEDERNGAIASVARAVTSGA